MTTTVSPPPAASGRPTDGAISAGAWSTPINGFRGLGAVIVVVGHTFFATRIFPFTGVIHFISIIVPIFFVVSAYALYRPFMVAHLEGAKQPDARAFWWRRFLRIYPLYFVALTFYLVLLPGVRPESGRVIDYLKLYGFMQIYDPDLVTFSGIPAAWFLCDEVVFYLMIPGIALLGRWLAPRLARRRRLDAADVLRAHTAIAFAMIAIGQVSRTWLLLIDFPGATSLPISNLDYYGFGILLAIGSLRDHGGLGLPRPVDWLRRRPAVALAVLAAGALAMNGVANIAGTTQSRWEDVQRYGVYSLIVVPFMLVMALGFQDRSYNRWFSSPRWSLLALLSLHIYLWHQLVLGGFDRYVTEVAELQIGSRFTTGVVMAIGAVVVTVAWSALLRPILDRPYTRWSQALPRPVDARSAPAWMRPAALAAAGAVLVGGIWVSLTYGGSPLQATGGVGIISVVDGRSGDEVLVRREGDLVGRYNLDQQGALVVRGLRPGTHTVRQQRDGRAVVTRVVDVLAPDQHPPRSLYEGQRLEPGMNYLTTRDGTKLAAWVELPGPADEGPYPTVVEYSGYQIADPDVTQPASAVARALGYATVGVNVRGTGCSAGAFDLLSPARAADGYDVVETVAAQDWVAGGTVGLVGFSYGGLGALEVASTAPPSLSGVAALAVYGRAREALQPGGLGNSGFPVGWMQDLAQDAEPLGAEWVRERVADGDATCARNQVLHGQAVDLIDRYLDDAPDDGRFDALGVDTWARTVEAPVFLGGQLQDATIGSDLADHLADFERSPLTRLVLTNGTHGDAVSPQVLARMDQFLALYVAGEVPDAFDTADLLAKTRPEVDPELVPDGPPPPVELTGLGSVDEARAAYEAGPKVEVLFESGNGGRPEAAAAASSLGFDAWPPAEGEETTWALAPSGQLTEAPPATAPPARFRTDPTVSGEAYNIEGSDLATNAVSPWRAPRTGTAAVWRSEPLAADAALVGSTRVDLWVRLDQPDADLQAVLSEVTPDGDEIFIQAGWRRVSDSLGERAGANTWVPVSIRLGPAGHLLRAGSQLRLQIGTPGAGQVQWSFYPPPSGTTVVEVGQSAAQRSQLVAGLVPTAIDHDRPRCDVLRGQPCRPDQPFRNDEGTS